jgi:uncharacterized repeat protein (TIGR03803 family)
MLNTIAAVRMGHRGTPRASNGRLKAVLRLPIGLPTCLVILASHCSAQALPWTLATVYSFQGSPDGVSPEAPLAAGEKGALYGTTYFGGTTGSGTVFELQPPTVAGGNWTETVISNFEAGGAQPTAGVVIGKGGALYGTTRLGGAFGYGTAFELTRPVSPGGTWSQTVLHDFTDGADGADPFGQLILGPNGELYGTTCYGGSLNFGTVFELSRPAFPGGAWTETVLYNFTNGADGGYPTSGLAKDADGNLYGYANIVFELVPPAIAGGAWTLNTLHTFTGNLAGSHDGFTPVGVPAVGPNGVLYGVTMMGGNQGYSSCGDGCGTVFALKPPVSAGAAGDEKMLYWFNRNAGDGFYPNSGVIIGARGALYGTTSDTAFQLIPPSSEGGAWTESILATFTGENGFAPESGLIGVDGVLYGTTSLGGSAWIPSVADGYGIVFMLSQ